MQILCFYRICYIIIILIDKNRQWMSDEVEQEMAPVGKGQYGTEEELNVPEALVKDKRKGKM